MGLGIRNPKVPWTSLHGKVSPLYSLHKQRHMRNSNTSFKQKKKERTNRKGISVIHVYSNEDQLAVNFTTLNGPYWGYQWFWYINEAKGSFSVLY